MQQQNRSNFILGSINEARIVGPAIYDAWREALGPGYEMIALDGGKRFCASATAYNAHNLVANDSYISGGLYRRDRGHIGRAEEIITVQRFTRGTEHFCIGDDSFSARPGSIYLCDARYPSLCFSGPVELRNVLVPARLVECRDQLFQRSTFLDIPLTSPMGRVLSDAIDDLYIALDTDTTVSAEHLSNEFIELLNGLMSKRPRETQTRRVLRALALSMRRYLIQHLDTPGIGIDELCLQYHCSRTKVYRLFEPVGGIQRFLREQRLLRACRTIVNPSQKYTRIRDVAEYWGFENPSHFNRLFKQQFGVAPSDAWQAAQPERRQVVTASDDFAEEVRRFWANLQAA